MTEMLKKNAHPARRHGGRKPRPPAGLRPLRPSGAIGAALIMSLTSDFAEMGTFPFPGGWETAAMDPFMLAAFPKALAPAARRASEGLAAAIILTGDRLIQDSGERRWGRVIVDGDEVRIPYRHYQDPATPVADPAAELVRQAWLTRSSDGRVRQQAAQSLLKAPASWQVPHLLQLCGEYVIEIGRDIAEYASGQLQRDPSMLDAYRRFWRANPQFVALTYARAASYWAAYYRRTLSLKDYPPHVAMVQVETLVDS